METWRKELEALQLPVCVAKLVQQITDKERLDRERNTRNDEAHARIEASIADAAKARKEEILHLRNDLIREFRKQNGKVTP